MENHTTGMEFGATLPTQLRKRLRFLYDKSVDGKPTTPCRLPGCPGLVEREVRTGRPRWFHDVPKCTKEFRRRRGALDDAVSHLTSQLRSKVLNARDEYAVRSQLSWLLNVRATYPAPGEWSLSPPGDLTGTMDVGEVAALALAANSNHSNECLACRGTGTQSMRQASIDAVRAYYGALHEVAELLRRHQREAGGANAPVSDALTVVQREAERVSDVLSGVPGR